MRSHRLAAALVCVAVGIAAGCISKHVAPNPSAGVAHRTTTVIARNGATVLPGVTLEFTSTWDSAGFATVFTQDTDGAGEAQATLHSGGWIVYGRTSTLAGGCSFLVPPASRPPSDTVAVVLPFFSASSVSGVEHLAGRTDHSGTIVTLFGQDFRVTNSSGAWSFDHVPPGTWTLEYSHIGFAFGIGHVTVPAPGSNVVVPPDSIVSQP